MEFKRKRGDKNVIGLNESPTFIDGVLPTKRGTSALVLNHLFVRTEVQGIV